LTRNRLNNPFSNFRPHHILRSGAERVPGHLRLPMRDVVLQILPQFWRLANPACDIVHATVKDNERCRSARALNNRKFRAADTVHAANLEVLEAKIDNVFPRVQFFRTRNLRRLDARQPFLRDIVWLNYLRNYLVFAIFFIEIKYKKSRKQ